MLFLRYLKDRLIYIVCLLFAIGVVVLFFYLNNLPTYAAIDIIIWQCIIAIVLFAYDVYKWRKKHIELKRAIDSIEKQLLPLPTPTSLIEEDYHKLSECIDNELRNTISKTDKKVAEMVDYYTLWLHQVKVPLSAIDLILQTEGESQAKNQMHSEINRIEHYVEMVLNYLRLESMSSDLLIKPYSIKEIVNDAVRKHKNSFIRKKIAIEIDLEESTVITDRKWLLFVLEQLISNSLKYTNEGKISIFMEPSQKNNLIIKDTGIGIGAEDLPRIWERGFTGYNGRLHEKASGLGLYMCKKIADRLSILLSISSVSGEGTVVQITFPEESKY